MNLAQTLTSDPLDLLTRAALAVLCAVMLFMLAQQQLTASDNAASEVSAAEHLRRLEQRLAQDRLLYQEVAALAGQRQHSAAMDKLKEIAAAHPDNPRSLLWQGQLQYELGEVAASLASYRQAIDQEPGFIDKKSPLFVGKDIKLHVEEAQAKLQREQTLKPGDSSIKKALDELLYIKRRLAGGCE
jgi:tetratricopeptide (TPR) repeat protein